MAWTEPIFAYCERGQNAAFWAEPFNALSNAAFLLASLAALLAWTRSPPPAPGLTELALIALVATIGIGSFLFHTLANRWTQLADIIPIGLFMFAYAAYALRRFLAFSWPLTAAGLATFAALMIAGAAAPCPLAMRALVSGSACLNGSLGYVPALMMLAAVGLHARVIGHPAAPALLAASLILALSLTMRTLDLELCGATSLLGQRRGTHALWHTLNAVTLALLLTAAIRHGSRAHT